MQRILNTEALKHNGQEIKLCGWADTIRAHGKILFIDLRDKTGICQIVFAPGEIYELAKTIRPEWVIEITGIVNERPKNQQNEKLATGKIEIEAKQLKILAKAETLPFAIDGDGFDITEEKRLKYRYLDLRRKRLQNNLRTRHKVIQFMRNYLSKQGFVEVETPMLTKSTPEGARDFIVPARLQKGSFYALPQSPQQYKQLLMVAGIEKYFQVARCLRDEDPRGDRQAEHTQLDIEMSFVSQPDILELIEKLYIEVCKNLFPNKKITEIPFPRLTYRQAMEKYNSDKPDLRKDKNNKDELAFCFVLDFPMFEKSEGKGKYTAMHHPFTKPQTDDIKEIKKYPEKVLAFQHDFVLNGYEIGGGSIRTTDLEVLTAVFEVLGHKKKETQEQFKNYFEAFKYGVPPHGGIAPGIDRFLAVVLGEPNIREVIAFPKTGDNRDLMMDAPAEVSKKQLEELGLEVKKTAKGKNKN